MPGRLILRVLRLDLIQNVLRPLKLRLDPFAVQILLVRLWRAHLCRQLMFVGRTDDDCSDLPFSLRQRYGGRACDVTGGFVDGAGRSVFRT